MKTIFLIPILWLGLAGLPSVIAAENSLPPAVATLPEASLLPSATPEPTASAARSEPGLRFNFRGAPLETVLNYMSDAAGFVIVLETPVHGTVDMWSSQSVSKEEAVQLLDLALNKNGYSSRVQGRNLIVSTKDDAKKQNIPIHTGNDPAEIPLTAEMVMQIIPLSHIDATQASRDLGALLPGSATLTSNADSNSLIVTDTQINIHHIVEIVAALDTSIDTVSSVRVFPLKNADPVEMSQLLTSLFTTPTTPQAAGGGFGAGRLGGGFGNGAGGFGNAGVAGGFGGAGPGGFATGAGGTGNANTGPARSNRSTTSARSTPVVAVADPRTFSVVVTASKAQMPQIAEMISQLDTNSGRKQKVFVYTMENADVKQVETILKNLFQSSSSRSSATSTQADPLSSRASNNSQTTPTTSSLSIGSSSGSRTP